MAAEHGAGSGHAAGGSAGRRRAPKLLVFDVNETLSDMSPMAARFAAVGAPEHLATSWFASLLRDGFALTATGANPSFAALGSEALRNVLAGRVADLEGAVEHVMAGFAGLPVHPDVVEGITALAATGASLVTLSNGSTSVAQGLVDRNGLADAFDSLLSVEDAPRWKPAAEAYRYALEVCSTPADEAMLVAVHPWDVHGAHEAGLATAWVNRRGGGYPSYFTRPDLEVASLVELAARLGGEVGS